MPHQRPEMKKFHFCFSHFSKEAEGKKRLSLKFSGFSLVSMLEDRELLGSLQIKPSGSGNENARA